MTSEIQNKLNELLIAYSEKGIHLAEKMNPGLLEDDIKERTAWFPVDLCQEIIEMYSWKNGQIDDASTSESPFWFRDNAFCSIENAKVVYESVVKSYAKDNIPERDGIDLLRCFPFAEFDGNCYLLPCSSQSIDTKHERPVINQNGEIYYYSIEKMLDTVIEWVKHPDYNQFSPLPDNVELEIWRKHNPNIFS